MQYSTLSALRVAGIYVLFAATWILFSDQVVAWLFTEPDMYTLAQTYKGLTFVIITAILLLFLTLKSNRALEQAHEMDHLTGLLNLNLFRRSLDMKIKTVKPGQVIVLGYLDIDNFKSVNESIGFEKADEFLRDIALHLDNNALPGATLARTDADQFASFSIIGSDVDLEDHIRSFQRLFLKRAAQFGVNATCSIGVSQYPVDGTNAKELMVSATEALSRAKRQQNAIQYHDKALTEKALKRRQMILDLQNAIRDKQLSVVYQPKYNLESKNVSGAEVLVRWNHPVDGFISPAVFIPLAEDNGLSAEISRLVVQLSAQELGASELLGNQLQHLAINVSAAEFNDPDQMRALTLFINDLPELKPYIRIEITETATLSDMRKSLEIISKLQASGITFSVDDFGTGYTSLAMLKDLTVDEIKIDRSFVAGIENDERAKTIVNAIIAMANSFDINVVAEGVETQQQLDALTQMGCREAQGYFLGRPMPVSEFIEHVKTPQ